MSSITTLTALQLASALHARRVSAIEALDAYFDAIDATGGELNCYVTLAREQAYARAAEIQARLDAGDIRSPLAGVPFAAQDLICTEGIATTCASEMLGTFVPPYNAAAVERLLAADMILLGKTNLDEFGLGSRDDSAVAVAAGLAPIAIGIDTGGNLRQSAARHGVVALKPTYGTVSRHGGVIAVSSMDQIGPIGRDAADCAALYALIKGADPRDGMSVEHPNTPALPLADIRIGKCIDLPMLEYAVSTYHIIADAEISSNMARYDGITWGRSSPRADSLKETYILSRSEGFGLEVKRRLMLGNFALSSGYYDAYYTKAQQSRRLIAQDFERAFETCDVILLPVAPSDDSVANADPLSNYLRDVYTVMPSLAGLPALALPNGVQLIGRAFEEATLFAAAQGIAG